VRNINYERIVAITPCKCATCKARRRETAELITSGKRKEDSVKPTFSKWAKAALVCYLCIMIGTFSAIIFIMLGDLN
jgi:hypothetical protein